MVATSPLRNDINSLGPGAQVEMQPTAQAYLNQTSSSSSSWMSCLGGEMGASGSGNGTGHHHMMVGGSGGMSGGMPGGMGMMSGMSGPYDQLGNVMGGSSAAGFGSDEEDCFDQMSDQEGGGDDSVSSSGGGISGPSTGLVDDTRIQQL